MKVTPIKILFAAEVIIKPVVTAFPVKFTKRKIKQIIDRLYFVRDFFKDIGFFVQFKHVSFSFLNYPVLGGIQPIRLLYH